MPEHEDATHHRSEHGRSLPDGRRLSRKQTRKSFVFCHHLQRPAVPCSEVIVPEALSDAVGESIPTRSNFADCLGSGSPRWFGSQIHRWSAWVNPLLRHSAARQLDINSRSGKLASLLVRSSFAVLEMSVGWRDFVQPLITVCVKHQKKP